MGKSKYTESECEQLYSIACAQGWDALEQSEKIAVGRWCTRNGRKRPPLVPVSKPHPAKDGGGRPDVTGRFKERDEEDLRLVKSVRILETFPDDIITARSAASYGDAVEVLKWCGKPCVVASGMSRKRAMELRQTIRRAKTGTWAPMGAFRAEVAPDHDKDGFYRVIAQYLGGDDGR